MKADSFGSLFYISIEMWVGLKACVLAGPISVSHPDLK